MIAVKEFSWEEVSSPDFGARAAWREAVAAITEKAKAKLPAYSGDSCHPIRCKAATSSEGSLPPNPDESCTPAVPHRSAATPELIGSGCRYVVFHDGVPFTHRLSSEGNLVRVMEQPVKNRVSQRGIPQRLMPVVHRELTGDDGRTSPVSVFQEFEHITAVLITEGHQSPVIKKQ